MNANILYSVPAIAIMTMFVIVMELILSATQVRFRDVGVGVDLLLQIWMFATPIVYPLSAVTRLPWPLGWLYRRCPMVGAIESFAAWSCRGWRRTSCCWRSMAATAALRPQRTVLQARREHGRGRDLRGDSWPMIDLRFYRLSK